VENSVEKGGGLPGLSWSLSNDCRIAPQQASERSPCFKQTKTSDYTVVTEVTTDAFIAHTITVSASFALTTRRGPLIAQITRTNPRLTHAA